MVVRLQPFPLFKYPIFDRNSAYVLYLQERLILILHFRNHIKQAILFMKRCLLHKKHTILCSTAY